MMYAIEMGSDGMIYVPYFMKTRTGVQAVLKFCLRNLRGCNVVITDGKNLFTTPMRWAKVHDIHMKFHKNSFRNSKFDMGDTHTDTQAGSCSHKPTFIISK
jgi:hypothetical protein